MPKLILFLLVAMCVIGYLSSNQEKKLRHDLSNFVGSHAEIEWTEHNKHLVKWTTRGKECQAVIKNSTEGLSYSTEPSCS